MKFNILYQIPLQTVTITYEHRHTHKQDILKTLRMEISLCYLVIHVAVTVQVIKFWHTFQQLILVLLFVMLYFVAPWQR